MVIRRIYIVLFLCLSGIISLRFQCEKRFDCAQNVYGFVMGIQAYPDKDSIQVGDTIWLEVNEPTALKDGQTGNMIDYSGAANLGSAIGFQALSPETDQFDINAAQKFDFLVLQGRELRNPYRTLVREYLFTETNNRYLFKLAVVPREKGIFRLVFSNAANVYRKKDECTKASFTLNFKNTDQHRYLHASYTGDTTLVGGDYYFKVY